MLLCLIATFTPLRKEEEKNEDIQPTFEGSYPGNVWCDTNSNTNSRW